MSASKKIWCKIYELLFKLTHSYTFKSYYHNVPLFYSMKVPSIKVLYSCIYLPIRYYSKVTPVDKNPEFIQAFRTFINNKIL